MKTILCLVLAMLAVGCSKAADAPVPPKKLNIYIWSEYLPQPVIDEFTRRTGIAVTVDTYDSNETLMAKLASGVA